LAHIWDGYGNWLEIATESDEALVKRKITGTDSWRANHLTPHLQFVLRATCALSKAAGKAPKVLDFGCGLGRNSALLRRFFPGVIALDLPPMIERLEKSCADLYDGAYSDLAAALSGESITTIFDSVVFQHLVDADYCKWLANFVTSCTSVDAIVSIAIDGNDPFPLVMLRDRGWVDAHLSTESETYGTPHNLRLLLRDLPERFEHRRRPVCQDATRNMTGQNLDPPPVGDPKVVYITD